MAGKRYGKRGTTTVVTPLPFEFELERAGVEEVHQFTAKPRLDAGNLIVVLASLDKEEEMLPALSRSISKMLDNRDGTPEGWKAEMLPRTDEAPPSFRGPDGVIYPLSDVEVKGKFEAFESGSSRRRWLKLLLLDDDVTVDLNDLVDLAQDLIGEAAGRPTRPSA